MKRARKSGNGAMTTLGDMRAEEGPLITGSLQVVRRYPLDVDEYPDTVTLAWFEPHLVCKRRGGKASAALERICRAAAASPSAPYLPGPPLAFREMPIHELRVRLS